MNENRNNDRADGQQSTMVSIGLAIGTGFGVALGLVLDNLALGIAIGAGMGMAVGVAFGARNAPGALRAPASGVRWLTILVVVGIAVLLLAVGLTLLALLRAS